MKSCLVWREMACLARREAGLRRGFGWFSLLSACFKLHRDTLVSRLILQSESMCCGYFANGAIGRVKHF